jgi:hypothetical protein
MANEVDREQQSLSLERTPDCGERTDSSRN